MDKEAESTIRALDDKLRLDIKDGSEIINANY